MKHPKKIVLILIAMFLVSQLIGILVISIYSPKTTQILDSEGNLVNVTSYNLPYGTEPPKDLAPQTSLFSILISIAIAVFIILMLMKFKAEIFLRVWFFVVVTIALGISFNAFLIQIPNSSIIAIVIALPLAVFKIFKRNIYVHNLTELLIYPGIGAIFVPLLNVWTAVLLLIVISLYDAYAVWHSGFMQKMAKYQMEKVRVFPGFLVPHLGKRDKGSLKIKIKKSSTKSSQIRIPVAILGGGDVVFPMILAGTVLRQFGLVQALIVILGATLALSLLFYFSKKGKFYPAMPFITSGCFVALVLAFLV